jgi:hypothetical protein
MLYSLSKSFTSTAVGLAIAEGKLSLDDEVLKFFPDEAPDEPAANLRAMRVRDLLRMATGHQTEPELRREYAEGPLTGATWVRKFLAHPVPFKPGTHFQYNTPATYMQSAIVQKATGQTVLDYLGPRLFEPLGIDNPTWFTSPEGVSVGGYGLNLRTEDIARFGQLYLQQGEWNGKQLIGAEWVAEATALQTANGSSPRSDWDQGYGYQFWRSRHNAFRGDGAFGQFCIVMPEQDAVVAITAGLGDMQSVLDLVWDKLLPALGEGTLPENAEAQGKLAAKLVGLVMRMPEGAGTSDLAAKVSGTWYEFGENDRGIAALALDFGTDVPALLVRTAEGESRTPIGTMSWAKSQGGFANGLDKFLSVPMNPLKAASGAWTADDVYTVKLVLYETPFTSTLTFHFDGDRLVVDGQHNVAFGPTKTPQIVGTKSGSK